MRIERKKADPETYLVRWRGREEGPYGLDALRERLAAGQIGRMHEVYADGAWTTLDDLLQSIDRERKAEQEAKEQRTRNDHQRQIASQHELALQEVQRQNDLLAEQLEEMRRQQEKQPIKNAQSYAITQAGPFPQGAVPSTYGYQGTSGLAIAGFIFSLLNFIPFINFISWVFALVFSHVALADINRTPGLGGKGLAIAALAITYTVIILVLVIVRLELSGVIKMPHLY